MAYLYRHIRLDKNEVLKKLKKPKTEDHKNTLKEKWKERVLF